MRGTTWRECVVGSCNRRRNACRRVGELADLHPTITAPDAWLASHDRFALLADLWGAVAQSDLSVALVLHSSSEVARRAQQAGSLVQKAIRDGVLLDGRH